MSDDEMGRWQNAIREKVIKASGAPDNAIDGRGCDSGDPLDVTLAEIGQGINHAIELRDSLIEDLLQAMKWWADQEDGIPEDCWDAYARAKKHITGNEPVPVDG